MVTNLCVSANALFAVMMIPVFGFISPPCRVVVEKSLNSSTDSSSNFLALFMSSATVEIRMHNYVCTSHFRDAIIYRYITMS